MNALNVWPEVSTGKWIVSRTQPGTNNEIVFAECWKQEAANLCAAAPELLEACQAALAGFQEGKARMETYDLLFAAIARATGKGEA